MTQAISSSRALNARVKTRPHVGVSARSRRGKRLPAGGRIGCASMQRICGSRQSRPECLGHYVDGNGRAREVIAGPRGDGRVLVVDRDALTLGDRRLVALLAVEEPTENAALICAHYLRDAHRGRCRGVSAEDLAGRLFTEEDEAAWKLMSETDLRGLHGDACVDVLYSLEMVCTKVAARELRWCRRVRGEEGSSRPVPVCLRETIGALERYEPVRELTCGALTRHRDDPNVSTAVLRCELERLRVSPIVLNGKLRQAVLVAVEREGLSLSEIAIRCGRIKRDSKGNASGETSWLARRVGLLSESGSGQPTPWIHSDVLALIARDGLGISPHEVELG